MTDHHVSAAPDGEVHVAVTEPGIERVTVTPQEIRCGDLVTFRVVLTQPYFLGTLQVSMFPYAPPSTPMLLMPEVATVTVREPVEIRRIVPVPWGAQKPAGSWGPDPDFLVTALLEGAQHPAARTLDPIRIVRQANHRWPQTIPPGTLNATQWRRVHHVWQRGGTFPWHSHFETEFRDGRITITKRVRFRPEHGWNVDPGVWAAIKADWKAAIEARWNEHDIVFHRAHCVRGLACEDALSLGCCKYPVRIVCEFLDVDPQHAHSPAVVVREGSFSASTDRHRDVSNTLSDEGLWWQLPDPSERIADTIAHEFGHLLGLPDEYIPPEHSPGDPPGMGNESDFPIGVDPNHYEPIPGSLMNDNNSVMEHHLRWLARHVGHAMGDPLVPLPPIELE